MSAPSRAPSHNGTSTSTGASRPGGWPKRGGNANPARERTITRLAVLKAAAEFAATRPGATSADVLKIAEAWERWVNR
jgi:hypothetical protein